MRVDYRPATMSDVDPLAVLEHEVFPADRISRASFRRMVRSRSAAVTVAAAGDSIAGYFVVLFRQGSRAARLYSIAVDPRMAGEGIGRGLLAEAMSVAAGRGAGELRLEVRVDNGRAISLYEQAGFAPMRRVPGYYADGGAALRMSRLLATPPVRASAAATVDGTAR